MICRTAGQSPCELSPTTTGLPVFGYCYRDLHQGVWLNMYGVLAQLELVEASRRRYQKATIAGSQKGEAMLQVWSSS